MRTFDSLRLGDVFVAFTLLTGLPFLVPVAKRAGRRKTQSQGLSGRKCKEAGGQRWRRRTGSWERSAGAGGGKGWCGGQGTRGHGQPNNMRCVRRRSIAAAQFRPRACTKCSAYSDRILMSISWLWMAGDRGQPRGRDSSSYTRFSGDRGRGRQTHHFVKVFCCTLTQRCSSIAMMVLARRFMAWAKQTGRTVGGRSSQ